MITNIVRMYQDDTMHKLIMCVHLVDIQFNIHIVIQSTVYCKSSSYLMCT